MTFENGDIILVKVNHFSTWYKWLLAKLIQLFDRAYYHHCVLYIDGGIHEADSNGIVKRELSHLKYDEVCVLRLINPITAEERYSYLETARGLVGKKYDYWSTLFFQLIFRTVGLWFGRRSTAQNRLFCSEHCVLPIHKVRGYFVKPWLISPGDLRRSTGYHYVVFEGTYIE